MKLIVSFSIFIGAMIICILTGCTMIIALFIGLVAFIICGMLDGFKFKNLVHMSIDALKDAIVVVEVMFTIGFITAVWRSSGTITFFVYYGIKAITPGLFLLVTFLLSCLLSYALGTSFGVAGTVGVIFMTLARSGGVNEVLTAAVVMSGIYFGDRGSPISSSAILVANVTKTDLLDNVKRMMNTAAIPLTVTLIIYGIFSFLNPIKEVDPTFMNALQREFNISPWCIIPAVCMLILPLLKVPVLYCMYASVVSGMIISLSVQHMPFVDLIKAMFLGYESTGSLGPIINGGGLVTMIEVVFIIGISATYSGIFEGTKMLSSLQDKVTWLISKIGRFATMVLMSFVTLCIFCNQTIATMMCNDILKTPYENSGACKEELAIDIENSVILLAAVVPWAIACSVPLSFMQVGYEVLPFSFFIYLVPIFYAIQKKFANPFKTCK